MKKQNPVKAKGKTAVAGPEIEQGFKFQNALALLACIVLPILIYSNTFRSPFFFDDFQYILNNPDVQQIGSYSDRMVKARAATYFTFALNYHLGKFEVQGWHLANILLHVLTTLLVFLLTRKVFCYVYRKNTVFLPMAVALLFSAHPVHTEVVTYIVHRSESLCAFFYLMAVFLFAKGHEKSRIFYFFSLVCFVLALWSKEIASTLPVILLLFDYILLSDFDLKKVLEKKLYHLPFWMLLAGFFLYRHFYVGQIGDLGLSTRANWTHYTYCLVQPSVILRYLQLLLLPVGQTVDHFIWPPKSIFELKIALSISALLGGLGLIGATVRKSPSQHKVLLFGLIWFFVGLSPTSTFMPVQDAMAERRLYLPGWGFFLWLGLIYLKLLRPDFSEPEASTKKSRVWPLFVIGLHILLLALATWNRNKLYQTPEPGLWLESVARHPQNYRANNNLGVYYSQHNEYDKALSFFQKALAVVPNDSTSYFNLGLCYYSKGDYKKAIECYERSVAINPNSANAYNNLACIYYVLKDYPKASPLYEKAIQINPVFLDAYRNLGDICLAQGNFKKARFLYQKAVEINPGYEEAKRGLEIVKRAGF